MMYLRRMLVLAMAVLLGSTGLSGQEGPNDLERGWHHFANNEMTDAVSAFTAELENGPNPDAYLARSLAYAAMYKSNESLEDFYACYEHSPDPGIVTRAWWSRDVDYRKTDHVEFLENIMENHKGTLRYLAINDLANHYRSINKHSKSESYAEMSGTVDEWALLGEFENISESGFDKDFGALANPESDAVFINKVGALVQWFEMKQPRYDKWVDLEYFFYASNSIIYAQNFCESPEDRDVQFRIGVSGSVKVWVNDKLMFSEAEERNNDLDSYMFTARLNKGYNRILIQIGESEADNCNFMLRITDDEGTSYDDLKFHTEYMPYTREQTFESEVVPNPVVEHFNRAIEENPDELVNYLLLSEYLQYADMANECKRLLDEAYARFPNCTYLRVKQLMSYIRDDNSTMVSALVEEIKLKEPNNVLSLNLRFTEAVDLEKYEEAQNILDSLKAIQGWSTNVYNKSIKLASELEKREELFALADEAYDEYPDEYEFVLLKYKIEREVNSNPRGAYRILRRYLSKNYSESGLREMASYHFDSESSTSIQRGIGVYEDLVEHNPLAVGYYSTLARINFMLRNYSMATRYNKETIRIAPYVGNHYGTLAKTYGQIDRIADAEEMYRIAIQLDPYDYDARHELRNLKEEGSIFDLFDEVDVYELYDEAPGEEEFPEDNSIILNYDIQRVFYEGGGAEERITLLIKAFNASGVDDWKEYRIPVYGNQRGSIDKAEVIKTNGNRIAAETEGAYVVFENLEPGDAIHLTYRLQNHFSGKLADQLWGNHSFRYFIPVKSTRLQLLLPDSLNMNVRVENGAVESDTVSAGNGMSFYTWTAHDVPAIRYEPYMSTIQDVAPTVHYSTFEDWNFISDWYTDLARAKSKVDYEVELTSAEIFPDGADTLSDYDKARRIYDYIVRNIRYRSVSFLQSGLIPQRASRTLAVKQGDCKDVSVLFAALGKTVGLEADLVLVNTRDNGRKEMALPSIDFNHCIALVELDGQEEPIYVELTSDKLSFATQTTDLNGAFALTIPLHDERLVQADLLKSNAGVTSGIHRTTNTRFEGVALLTDRATVRTGLAAADMRDTYRDEGPIQQEKYMQNAIQDEYPGVRLTNLEFTSGLKENSDSLVYTHSYTATNVTTPIANMEIFRIPLGDAIRTAPSYLSTAERDYPVELWQAFIAREYTDELTIAIPAGKRLSDVPANVSIETADIRYKLTYRRQGNKLIVKRHFKLLDDLVEPEDYPEFKAAMEKIIKSDNQNIGFQG